MSTEPTHVYVQYKGTDICFDFYCVCGMQTHYDGYGAYTVKCGACGRLYALPTLLPVVPVDEIVEEGNYPHPFDGKPAGFCDHRDYAVVTTEPDPILEPDDPDGPFVDADGRTWFRRMDDTWTAAEETNLHPNHQGQGDLSAARPRQRVSHRREVLKDGTVIDYGVNDVRW